MNVKTQQRFIAPAFLACADAAHAAEPGVSTGSLLQTVFSLVVVLALMAAAAWLLKRFGVAKPGGNTPVKIVGGVNIGSRERILVVEVADQWIVVGVTASTINTLSTMPRQESAANATPIPEPKNFSEWLKHTLDKHNAHKT